MKKNSTYLLLGAALALAAASFAADKPATQPAAAAPAAPAAATPKPVPHAVAAIHAASSSTVSGTVSFLEVPGGVEVTAELSGLAPGKHGFHIHEFGDCSAPDATSAGGHYNPMGHPHAAKEADARHEGDLGNIEAGPDGKATVKFVDKMLELKGDRSVLGRGVIVHAAADDFTTQPTGNAGARVGCGIIGWAK